MQELPDAMCVQWSARRRFYKQFRRDLQIYSSREEAQRLWRERRRFYGEFQQDLQSFFRAKGSRGGDSVFGRGRAV